MSFEILILYQFYHSSKSLVIYQPRNASNILDTMFAACESVDFWSMLL
jgi:hypothetical protein